MHKYTFRISRNIYGDGREYFIQQAEVQPDAELKRTSNEYSRWDCTNKNIKFELKCRKKHYEELTIEKEMYDALMQHKRNRYICSTPQGVYSFNLHTTGTLSKPSTTGYEQQYTTYQAEECRWCPLRKQCHQQKGNRQIEVNHNLRRLKQRADNRLKIKKGVSNANNAAIIQNLCSPTSNTITSSGGSTCVENPK